MQWVQPHLASLPADIRQEKLTSGASMPRAHRKQTSKQEKLTSMPRRHQRQTSKKEMLASQPERHRMQTLKREKLTSEPSWLRRCAQTKGIGFNRHRRREVDIENALTRGRIAFSIINWLASLFSPKRTSSQWGFLPQKWPSSVFLISSPLSSGMPRSTASISNDAWTATSTSSLSSS